LPRRGMNFGRSETHLNGMNGFAWGERLLGKKKKGLPERGAYPFHKDRGGKFFSEEKRKKGGTPQVLGTSSFERKGKRKEGTFRRDRQEKGALKEASFWGGSVLYTTEGDYTKEKFPARGEGKKVNHPSRREKGNSSSQF